jgi:phospholipid/cholesterol/gamma-HCH transport system substrate-binding protein
MKVKDRKQAATLGLFLLVGVALFVAAIFLIGGKQHMFGSTFTLVGEFQTVGGLREGAAVRLLGINVGTVKKIEIATGNKVRVEMSIDEKAHSFIKSDSKMNITTEGLVGNKIVSIDGGTDGAPPVENNRSIPAEDPFNPEEMFRRLKETGDNTAKITAQVDSIVSRINSGRGTLGKLITDESLYRGMDSTMRGLTATFAEVDDLIHRITNRVDSVAYTISEVTRKLNSNKTLIGTILTDTTFADQMKDVISDAQLAVQNAEAGTRSFAQNMEALKHNFLFKGYFEDIGYWDRPAFETQQDSLDRKAAELRALEQELLEKQRRLDFLEDTLNARSSR